MFAKVLPKPFSPISGFKSMPLSLTPCVLGNNPVNIELLAGMQTAFGVIQFLNLVPSDANSSRCGVLTLRFSKP